MCWLFMIFAERYDFGLADYIIQWPSFFEEYRYKCKRKTTKRNKLNKTSNNYRSGLKPAFVLLNANDPCATGSHGSFEKELHK